MQSAVIVFPGSNCDRDMAVALETVSGQKPHMVWHGDTDLPAGLDVITIPGGFSYGDYLRSGAMASRSNIIKPVIEAAQRGVKILGVCNGFQILTETGLLPGALMRNSNMHFICKDAELEVINTDNIFTARYAGDTSVSIPVAHHDGNYFADDDTLDILEKDGRVVFRYQSAINGSARNIAGIINEAGNVLGMMPHPERAIDQKHGGTDGLALFESLLH
ncbi:MAG: phosphoribosylformylglycinamidine synthase subunit PurQ [Sphingomonadales bacterium]|nr:phosphoribosylformylglycinamidine synthase subunit PurQ [Sphingomonadales bacterium]PIX67574.1 MAG: phosphoribosylformylglycinamidine synthase subunit PurQ [Sphingomonadales bacterium CG_4_10_14_3_um_filter_58_15]NCO49322.1 phosphoribosylformylglycinamidine synthase subunit PurQ [Sphingomonadales bacterium]NCO99494.1 phosphoribosylformylglycinamidine synthase subunit PurQ [Sphingomonadales bacterium]NCP27796.1 phosphoribosylformylglycinamidine synthase subunit PurQ [Sphingomonadales bacteriu